MLENFDNALLANDDMLFSNEYFNNSPLLLIKYKFLLQILINVHNNNNFYEDDPDTIIHVRLLVWCSKFEKRKTSTKMINEELLTVVWYPKK